MSDFTSKYKGYLGIPNEGSGIRVYLENETDSIEYSTTGENLTDFLDSLYDYAHGSLDKVYAHLNDTNNPHRVTATQIGAVSLTGDEVITGNKSFSGNVSINNVVYTNKDNQIINANKFSIASNNNFVTISPSTMTWGNKSISNSISYVNNSIVPQGSIDIGDSNNSFKNLYATNVYSSNIHSNSIIELTKDSVNKITMSVTEPNTTGYIDISSISNNNKVNFGIYQGKESYSLSLTTREFIDVVQQDCVSLKYTAVGSTGSYKTALVFHNNGIDAASGYRIDLRGFNDISAYSLTSHTTVNVSDSIGQLENNSRVVYNLSKTMIGPATMTMFSERYDSNVEKGTYIPIGSGNVPYQQALSTFGVTAQARIDNYYDNLNNGWSASAASRNAYGHVDIHWIANNIKSIDNLSQTTSASIYLNNDSVVPDANYPVYLGSNTNKWRNIYTKELNADSIMLNNSSLTEYITNITVNDLSTDIVQSVLTNSIIQIKF